MQYSLIKEILNFIIDNKDEFQIHKRTTRQFRDYIFNDQGEYLAHGGKQVSEFINKSIKLIQDGAKNNG